MNKIAFVFSGQGAQQVRMGKELYDNFSESKEVFDTASTILGYDISRMCFEGPEEELMLTYNTQPAVLTMSIAAYKILSKKGIKPDVTAGLSLGEYSALVCSGALEFKDVVSFVKNRGRYMQDAVPYGIGGMAAIIGLTEDQVMEVCDKSKDVGIIEAANFNCPGQIVISGEIAAIDKGCEVATQMGALKAIKLSVSGPFHSSMMKKAYDKLVIDIEKLEVKQFEIPLVSNVTADFIDNEEMLRRLMGLQVMCPVQWERTIRKMIDFGVDTFVEIGPGRALSGFIRKVDKGLTVLNVEDLKSLEKTLNVIGG